MDITSAPAPIPWRVCALLECLLCIYYIVLADTALRRTLDALNEEPKYCVLRSKTLVKCLPDTEIAVSCVFVSSIASVLRRKVAGPQLALIVSAQLAVLTVLSAALVAAQMTLPIQVLGATRDVHDGHRVLMFALSCCLRRTIAPNQNLMCA